MSGFPAGGEGPALGRGGSARTRRTPLARIAPILRRRGIRCTNRDKAGQSRTRKKRGSLGGRPPKSDQVDYRERQAGEHGIDRLERHRAVAALYHQLAVRYEATVLAATVNEWL